MTLREVMREALELHPVHAGAAHESVFARSCFIAMQEAGTPTATKSIPDFETVPHAEMDYLHLGLALRGLMENEPGIRARI